MLQNEHDKFSLLLTNVLIGAGIEYASGKKGEAYVVYNDFGILFNITYRKDINKYIYDCTELFKSEYKKYGLPVNAVPDVEKLFESVAFAYKTRDISKRAQKDFSILYKELLVGSDITFKQQDNFEIYIVYHTGFKGFAIGYDPKTKKYGFKRYELIHALYKACNISQDKKPDYPSLYKRAKDAYMAQVAVECMRDFDFY